MDIRKRVRELNGELKNVLDFAAEETVMSWAVGLYGAAYGKAYCEGAEDMLKAVSNAIGNLTPGKLIVDRVASDKKEGEGG